jgi:ATP-dependent DNA helicase RecQ
MAYQLNDVITLSQMLQASEGSEQYKRITLQKLDAMLALCEMTSCRRQALLAYFNEELKEPCGNCDNCLDPPVTWDGTEAAQKALSCVYRTGQRFGVSYLVDVLNGSDNPRIKNNKHDQLSTFGIGTDLNKTVWRSLYRQLIARAYLQVDIDGYGGIRLTEKCRGILKGQKSIYFRESVKTRKSAASSKRTKLITLELKDHDLPLFDALKALRTELASQQNVPPYVVFHDRTLIAMAKNRPTDTSEMELISGVGVKKLERYGDDFLNVIAMTSLENTT